MNFSDKLDKAVFQECVIGTPVSEHNGKRIDFNLSVIGKKYEIYLNESHYMLAENGVVKFMTEERQEIEEKLSTIISEGIN